MVPNSHKIRSTELRPADAGHHQTKGGRQQKKHALEMENSHLTYFLLKDGGNDVHKANGRTARSARPRRPGHSSGSPFSKPLTERIDVKHGQITAPLPKKIIPQIKLTAKSSTKPVWPISATKKICLEFVLGHQTHEFFKLSDFLIPGKSKEQRGGGRTLL